MGKQDSLEGFDQFWKLYPKKKGRKDAAKAWEKLKPDKIQRAVLIASLAKHCVSADWTKDGGRYVPNPATWLNGERWEDVLTPAGGKPSTHTNLDQIDYTDGLELDEHGNYRIAGSDR